MTQFFTLQNGSLSFIHDFNHGEGTLATGLVIPPSWTLGVEFAFYLVAPCFIVRRSARAIAAVLFASLALRLILQFGFSLQDDPWSYRFFPSELAVFLVGALGYRVFSSSSNDAGRRIFVLFAVACVCTAAALLINRWHGPSRVASVGLFLLLVLAIPQLFRRSKANIVDRTLGELSYPIYICHYPLIWAVDNLLAMQIEVGRGFVILALTMILAAILYWAVDRPVDAWRHSRLGPRPVRTAAASSLAAGALPSGEANAVVPPSS